MKRKFITGLVAILPIGLTLFVLQFLVLRIGGLLKVAFRRIPWLSLLPSPIISIIGFLSILLLIYMIGVITSSYIGNRLLKFAENLISKLPIIRTLYTAVRRFTNAIFIDKSAFKKAILIEYPRRGIYTLAFMTNESSWDIDTIGANISLFVPTTPNPTSGFYLVVPRAEVRETNLTIDEALRTIISGGVILPKHRQTRRLGGEKDETDTPAT
jgi:uncharacterized membrane protein